MIKMYIIQFKTLKVNKVTMLFEHRLNLLKLVSKFKRLVFHE